VKDTFVGSPVTVHPPGPAGIQSIVIAVTVTPPPGQFAVANNPMGVADAAGMHTPTAIAKSTARSTLSITFLFLVKVLILRLSISTLHDRWDASNPTLLTRRLKTPQLLLTHTTA
jgi:hypothetical protein